MGFTDLFGIADKILGLLPKRAEGMKNEIDKLEQRQAFISIHKRNDLAREYARNERRLQRLRKEIANRAS